MAKKIEMIGVDDNKVKEVGYDEKSQTLYINYRNGKKQTFTDIKLKSVEKLLISKNMEKTLKKL